MKHMHVHTRTHTHSYIITQSFYYTHKHTYSHNLTHSYIYIYIYYNHCITHTHTHTQTDHEFDLSMVQAGSSLRPVCQHSELDLLFIILLCGTTPSQMKSRQSQRHRSFDIKLTADFEERH